MFSLDIGEQIRLSEWLQDHSNSCPFNSPENQGAIGGRLTYCFTPTSLGTITKVQCACGQSVDVTDYDW
jgi:hypothetical protein